MPYPKGAVLTLRSTHRSVGIVLAIFLATIALSGTMLQIIISIYGDTGPMQAPGEPFWVARLRDLAVTVHTGAFAGISGVYCGVIFALGLLFFTVSGVLMYLRMYRARAAQGNKAVFWQSGSGTNAAMRLLHRWITLPFALFALLLSITGASLDLYFARYNTVPLPPPRRMGAPGGGPQFGEGPRAGRSPEGGALGPGSGGPPNGVRSGGGGPPGPRGPGGPGGPQGAGRVWHDLSLSVHKLNFLGRTGHVLGVVLGLALLLLALSGAWMFTAMYGQRRKAGLPDIFW